METYELALEAGRLVFGKKDFVVPDFARDARLPAEKDDYDAFCLMGDPDLLHCIIYRRKSRPGGLFAARDGFGPLFVASADSALIWAAALARFGEMTANARYGADVFENMEEPDD